MKNPGEQAILAGRMYILTLPQLVGQAFCAFQQYPAVNKVNVFFAVDLWVKRVSFHRNKMPASLADISKTPSQELGELYAMEGHDDIPYLFLVQKEPVAGGAPDTETRSQDFVNTASSSNEGGVQTKADLDVGELCNALRNWQLEDGGDEPDTDEFLPEDEVASTKLYFSSQFEEDWEVTNSDAIASLMAIIAGKPSEVDVSNTESDGASD